MEKPTKEKDLKPIRPRHPLVLESNKLSAEGKPIQAAKTILKLFSLLKNKSDKANVLIAAANLLKIVDYEKSIDLSRKATIVDPNLAKGWISLSIILFDRKMKKNKQEAILALDKAKTLNPEASALIEIGRQYSVLGEDQKAINVVRDGYDKSDGALNILSYSLRVALQYADWDLSQKIIKKILSAYKSNEFEQVSETHLLWCNDEISNIRVISNFAKKAYPDKDELRKHDLKKMRSENKKIRIGYISYDFREHATSLLILGLLRHHNKANFEIYAYCCSFDDGSALRREALSKFDRARTLSKFDDKKAAEIIMNDKIEILVDLNGLTEGSRLGIMAYKPAPIQISYLAFPGTAGGRFIDYIIADNYVVPENANLIYPEKIIKIPHTYQINDYRAKYLPPKASKKIFSINENVSVIGMFNNINKVNYEVWTAWMSILKQSSDTILWILDPGEVAKNNILIEATKKGILSERILFAQKLPQQEHFARLQNCDLILDPWPYGGHTTTSDALFAGCPVVALEGKNFASRVSGGLLRSSGLENLIAPTIEEYIKISVDLLSDKNKLSEIKKILLASRFKIDIFNAPMRTFYIEAAYCHAIKRALDGLPTAHYSVETNLAIKE